MDKPIVFIHKEMLGLNLFEYLNSLLKLDRTPIAIGYKHGYVSAKLVLMKGFGKDVVKEVDV